MTTKIPNPSKETLRSVMQFLWAEEISPMEIHSRMKAVYGEKSLAYSTIKEWIRNFNKGRTSVTDRARSGAPVTATTERIVQKVNDKIIANRRVSVKDIAFELGVSSGSVWTVITSKLKLKKRCCQWVPHSLNDEQKRKRKALSLEHLTRFTNEPTLLDHVVTGDESYCFLYDPCGKRQSAEWRSSGESPPKKTRRDPYSKKVMMTFFFDNKGPVLLEFAENKSRVNSVAYQETLVRLRKALKNKRPGKLSSGVILLHDNARPHTAARTQEMIAKFRWEVLRHPPYSPDLSPCDYHVFSPLKKHLRSCHFASDGDLKAEASKWLRHQPKEFYQKGINRLIDQWRNCVISDGYYF